MPKWTINDRRRRKRWINNNWENSLTSKDSKNEEASKVNSTTTSTTKMSLVDYGFDGSILVLYGICVAFVDKCIEHGAHAIIMNLYRNVAPSVHIYVGITVYVYLFFFFFSLLYFYLQEKTHFIDAVHSTRNFDCTRCLYRRWILCLSFDWQILFVSSAFNCPLNTTRFFFLLIL